MELKPGVSAYEKYGLEPPSPLPLNATTKTPQMLRGIRNIVRLSEWFVDREDNIEPDIRGISDSTGTLPTFLTMEATAACMLLNLLGRKSWDRPGQRWTAAPP